MYRTFLFAAVAWMMYGCGSPRTPPVDVAQEKAAIKSLIRYFHLAYETRDQSALENLFSTSMEMVWFGTDSAEVIRNIPAWEGQMKNDWELFDSFRTGEVRNLSIQVSGDGEFASAVWEVPAVVKVGGKESASLFRFGGGLTKENGRWRFTQGLAAVATVGQSSAELVAKMKAPKPGKK
jgi:ketosteroid isomerase-like protein